ncbi:6-carboxytetrahydropterin synthase [Alteromonas gilva]|uniref:6-carboxy-5,6,7,8-tetrahydropterin synthase n=1 Tax=Alteromonas gilva TaxID=2987522 RepID=A0ABT5L3G7_9ALTE|nr:6-carboxytetrahydropterin synthase [Alteromonas gilva]MDC8830979.1 6-carboxytetrahydropterin synthase [Alteromonas gilva]
MQLFVNDLTVMDFSYLCPERGMVGESWIVDVLLDGTLNEESMVQDFGIVKKNLKRLIDEYVDHKLLVPAECPATTIRHEDDSDQVEVNFDLDATKENGRRIQMYCPADAYAFIYAPVITMESVSEYLREVIATHLPDNVDNLTIKLRTEVITSPFYHYTHGLKKHDGNCQRIAHGHRSRVDIISDGANDVESQQYWAKRWQDIYIASSEDRITPAALQLKQRLNNYDEHVCFAYESTQGYFEIVLPQSMCEIIDTDSTVECLAQYIYNQQKQRLPDTHCCVLAYEGVGKGAMVSD